MKNLLLKFFASDALKSGISYALKVTSILVDTLSSILNSFALSDEQRKKMESALKASLSVRDFLAKLVSILGISSPSVKDVSDDCDKLNSITDSL